MDSIDFLELSDVGQIHIDQIENYGGAAEIRDRALRESAIEQPRESLGGSYRSSCPRLGSVELLGTSVADNARCLQRASDVLSDFARNCGVDKRSIRCTIVIPLVTRLLRLNDDQESCKAWQ